MPRTVTHKPDSPNDDDVLAASENQGTCNPPATSAPMRICGAAANIILAASDVARRAKYEKASSLRSDFSKAGKVTFTLSFLKNGAARQKSWSAIGLPV